MTETFTALILFIAGASCGALALWLWRPSERNHRQLQRQLDQSHKDMQHYRGEVDQHFFRTAQLINNLTDSYQAVHQQLSSGASTLCSEEGRKRAMAKSLNRPLDTLPNGQPLQAPLDYAPSHKGTLSEDFGLRQDSNKADAANENQDTDNSATTTAPPRDYADGCDAQGCPPEENSKTAVGE